MSRNRTYGNILTQERLDLEKYMKFLALKTIQVIVQSRFGVKQKSKCNPSPSSHDWFNIAIEDHPEVQDQARKALGGQTPLIDSPMCVEISLKTSDGDVLVLETWSMTLHPDRCDSNVSAASVYYHMTLLLKSAIAVTRVTPVYKLSCRQSSDSYVILYRVYTGPPQYHQLGKEPHKYPIGEVITPIGSVAMSVCCRTEMTITPQKIERESLCMLTSDHFKKADMSPKKTRPGSRGFHADFNMNCRPSPDECMKAGAFAPSTKIPDPSSLPDILLPDTPFLKLLGSSNSNGSIQQRLPKQDSSQNSDKNANLNIVAACDRNGSVNNIDRVDYNCNANEAACKSGCSDGSDCGDFVMVDLVRPPFADCDTSTDLGAFFRECQCAPPLASFACQPTLEEQVTDITSQLAKFETTMPDIDNFVDSICQIGDQK